MPLQPKALRPKRAGIIDGLDMQMYEARPAPDRTEAVGTIAVVTRDMVSAPTAISMMGIDGAIGRFAEPNQYVKKFIIVGQILTFQRNQCLHAMEGDWILFIDADMVWQPEDIATLVETQKKFDLDIIGGLCFQRLPPYQPTLYKKVPDEDAYTFLEQWPDDSALEVDATGMAFCLIHKRVLDRITQKYGDFEYPGFEERQKYRPVPFFRWDGFWGEDFQFCREATASGSRVFVDTSVKVTHMGYVPIDENTFYHEIAHRPPATEAFRESVLSAFDSHALTREAATLKLEPWREEEDAAPVRG